MQPTRYSLPEAVSQALSRWGLILQQDKVLPSVVSTIAGGPIAGSWWGNPAATGTFEALQALDEMPDVLCTKLVSGKVTFVLDRLWPAVIAIGQSRESWQVDGLSSEDHSLLRLVDGAGSIRLDELPGPSKMIREPARVLEHRLLVHGSELHTESGAHTKVLETWEAWLEGGKREVEPMAVDAAKVMLEDAVAAVNSHFGARGLLPWQTSSRSR